jgi:DNA-binding response OmpR family regulator
LVLLDLLLPKVDGITVCHELRRRGFGGPILMMTARGATPNKVLGLDAGADDYLVKPFDLEELSARIRALLRRGKTEGQPVLSWGDLHINPAKCTATFNGAEIALTPTEYRLLTFFLRNCEQIFSTESLLQRLWLSDENRTKDVIKAHMKGLRRKLREAGLTQDVIETIHGFGYRLKPNRQ